MISQYFLSSYSANFSWNYFVPFFQGQRLILSCSHYCLKVFPFPPGSSHCWPWARRWTKQMPCEELSGISGPCQADARLPISPKPCHFLLVKLKKMARPTELGTEMSCKALLPGECGSAQFSPGAVVLGKEWELQSVCPVHRDCRAEWSCNGPCLRPASSSWVHQQAQMKREFGFFWQVQPAWSLRSLILTSNNLKVLNCKVSQRKGWQLLIFFRILQPLPEGFSHSHCNKWLTCFWRDTGVYELVLNFPFASCCFFCLKIPQTTKPEHWFLPVKIINR